MGNSKSVIRQTITATSTIVADTIVKNVTDCQMTASASQSIRFELGDNANVQLNDTTLNSTIDSKLACLMTTHTTNTEVTSIKDSISQNMNQITDVFPKLQANISTKVDIKQAYVSYIKNNIEISNILKSLQDLKVKQAIDITAGHNATILFNNVTLDSSIVALNEIVSNNIVTLSKEFIKTSEFSSELTLEEKNSATDMIEHLGDNIADVAKSGISTAGNIAMISAIVMMVIVVALIIMAPKLLPMLLAGAKLGTSPVASGLDSFLMVDSVKQVPVTNDDGTPKIDETTGKQIINSVPGRKLSNNAKLAIGALITLMIGLILAMALL
jgi:hypothetical protein